MLFRVEIPRLPDSKLNPNVTSRAGNLWFRYAASKKEDGETALLSAKTSRLPRSMPWDSVKVKVTYVLGYVKSPRRRDWDNLIGSTKGFWDGLVKAGVLTDDSMDVVQEVTFSKELRKGHYSATIFEIEEM